MLKQREKLRKQLLKKEQIQTNQISRWFKATF